MSIDEPLPAALTREFFGSYPDASRAGAGSSAFAADDASTGSPHACARSPESMSTVRQLIPLAPADGQASKASRTVCTKAGMVDQTRPCRIGRGPRVALAALVMLAGCNGLPGFVGPGPAADPEIARLNGKLAGDAGEFYAALEPKAAPDCSFEANKTAYATLREDVAALRNRAETTPNDSLVRRSTDGLDRTVAAAERSHQLASARTDDRFGVCMAPEAIKLNADAIARATAKVHQLQEARRQ